MLSFIEFMSEAENQVLSAKTRDTISKNKTK
jgi:hypothetical protein